MEEIERYYQELHDSLGTEELCQEFVKQVMQTMQDVFDQIPDGARVGIRGAGNHTKELLEALRLSGKNIVGIYDRGAIEARFCGYPLYPASDIQTMALDCIIISNYFYRDEIREELANSPVPVVDLYAVLEERGLTLRGPFYMCGPDTPLVLNHFYWNYRNRKCEETLRELLQAALEQKCFVLISQLSEENGGADGACPVLIRIWIGVQRLLELIQEKLQARKQRDIILFWTDAMSFSDLDSMPETKRRAETNACFFQRTYTHTPYTNATLRAMFQGKLPIDDYPNMEQIVDRGNSPLLQYLEDMGYDFRFFVQIGLEISSNYKTERSYASNTAIWWCGLQHLLKQQRPCFYIFQFSAECHIPISYPTQARGYIGLIYKKKSSAELAREASLRYLDQCLTLYDWLLGDKVQVVLSDHGADWEDQEFWREARLHAYCFVKGEGIPAINVQQFFPYQNFMNLVRWIIDPAQTPLETITSDEVQFQDTDYYNSISVLSMLKGGIPRRGLAYRGVQTERYKYVINALGEDFFCLSQDGEEIPLPLKDEELRAELRKKCGMHFLDIRKYKRFQYSKELYKAIRETEPESNQPLWLTEES